jgi:YegS/Rv2252/BmrU family lipid kinase
MGQRELVLISNPNAGRGGARRAREVAEFCEMLKQRGLLVEALHTRAPGDAEELARKAVREGAREVIVSGGDGTINEAVQGLIGSDVRLGIWPRGTANVLARELGLPFKPDQLAEVIARGHTRSIYAGCALKEATGERRYFCLMAGIGLDASIVRGVPSGLKRRIGKGAFWYSGLGHLARWQPVPFTVEVDGQIFQATFTAIGKAAHYGGDLSITPHARLDQPEFEICLIDTESRLRYLHLLSHAMGAGVQERTPASRLIRATRARAYGPTSVQVDGELIGDLPMTFEIIPHPLQVITGS